MKILALLLIAFALTGGELADSPLQQRVVSFGMRTEGPAE